MLDWDRFCSMILLLNLVMNSILVRYYVGSRGLDLLVCDLLDDMRTDRLIDGRRWRWRCLVRMW